MIIDTVLGFFAGVLGFMWGLLPEWNVELPEVFSTFVATARAYDDVLPITEIFACIGLRVSLVLGMTLFRWGKQVMDWVADIIP